MILKNNKGKYLNITILNETIIYIPDDGTGSIALSGYIDEDLINNYTENQWISGALLDTMDMELSLHIGDINEKSLSIIRGSITNHVMTPLSPL